MTKNPGKNIHQSFLISNNNTFKTNAFEFLEINIYLSKIQAKPHPPLTNTTQCGQFIGYAIYAGGVIAGRI